MAVILLSQGKLATVDDNDHAWLSRFKWSADRRGGQGETWYAVRTFRDAAGIWRKLYMHRAIMHPGDEQEIDHIDGDGLNNCRVNLRLATRTGNNRNQRRPSSNTSGIKGVSWDRAAAKWQVKITVDRRQIHLGRYDDPEQARAVYVAAVARYHGEFGRA